MIPDEFDPDQLTDEYLQEYLFFSAETSCCSCHINPPCAYCTHPGNPDNLMETEEAWVDEQSPNDSIAWDEIKRICR